MPRLSPEARAASAQRVAHQYPAAPPHLLDNEKSLWDCIASSKPADYWEPGNLPLLENYVLTLLDLRRARVALDEAGPTQMNPQSGMTAPSGEFVVVERLTRQAAMLASKLRLSMQAAYRSDGGKMNEKASDRTSLIGGNVVSLRS